MDKIENIANKYVERHIRDRHLSDDTIKEIKIAYIMIIKDFIAIVDKSTSMNEDDIIYVVNNDRWEYKNSQSDCFKQSAGYFFSCHTISAIFLYQNTN